MDLIFIYCNMIAIVVIASLSCHMIIFFCVCSWNKVSLMIVIEYCCLYSLYCVLDFQDLPTSCKFVPLNMI